MERKPFTLRLDAELYEALSSLSDVAHRSMNDLVTEAVSRFVAIESKAAARDLEETLAKLRRYAESDPDFEQEIREFAEAEVLYDDPAEGKPVIRSETVRERIRTLLTDA